MGFSVFLYFFKNVHFKKFLNIIGCLSPGVFLVFLLLSAPEVLAYKITQNDIKDDPYQNYVLGDVNNKEENILLGKLNNFPVLYTFSLNKNETFNFIIRQPDLKNVNFNSPQPLTFLVVKKNDKAQFTEVSRIQTEVKDWQLTKDKKLGLKMWKISPVELTLEAGTYSLEISSPDNIGYFQVIFGKDDDSVGYMKNLQKVIFIRDFFGYNRLSVLKSQLVYLPIVLIFIIYTTFKIYRYIHRFKT